MSSAVGAKVTHSHKMALAQGDIAQHTVLLGAKGFSTTTGSL